MFNYRVCKKKVAIYRPFQIQISHRVLYDLTTLILQAEDYLI